MAARMLGLMLLAACGRIGFGASDVPPADIASCVPIGHDEDADGVDDGCDLCPQLADSQADRDGDAVGDLCDPHPDEARDTIVTFDPFTELRPEWDFPSRQPVFTGDSIIGDSRGGQFRADRPEAPVDDRYTFAVTLRRAAPTGQRQLALYALEDDTHVYFCDLDQNPNGLFWAQIFTINGLDYTSLTTSPLTGPLEDAPVMVTLDQEPARWTCRTDWPVDQPVLVAAIPGDIVPAIVALSAINLEVEITSFFHVHSN
jgi:hypothetical protein